MSGVSALPLLTFDLDGVLCRPPFGINPGRNQGKSRTGEGRKNLLWLTERWRYIGRGPMPGAREGFRLLAERYDCRVLSARSDVARNVAERWFARHIGIVPTMYFRDGWVERPAQFKTRIVGELKPVAHFEDDPHTAQWVAELIPAVFLVDWPRNRWLEAANVHRIRELRDALAVLEEIQHTAPEAD